MIKKITAKIINIFYNTPRILFVNYYKLLTRTKVFNIKRIPEGKSAIFAINHITGADPIIILGVLKKKIYFLAESENFRNRFTNFFMRKFTNSIPIFKKEFMKNIRSFKELFSISDKKNIFLGIFPEGNLNKKEKLGKFHKGAAYFSYKTKLPIVPVYIHNLLKGPGEKRWIGRNNVVEGIIALTINTFRKIHIFIGKPIDPMAENIIEDFKDLTDKKACKQITENIHKALLDEFLELENEADKLFGTPESEDSEDNAFLESDQEDMTNEDFILKATSIKE